MLIKRLILLLIISAAVFALQAQTVNKKVRGLSLAPKDADTSASVADVDEAEAQKHGASGNVKYGIKLTAKEEEEQAEGGEQKKQGAGASGNVKYGTVLGPVEKDTAAGPKIEKRLINQNDSTITAVWDSLEAALQPQEEEDDSYEHAFKRSEKEIQEAYRDSVSIIRVPHLSGWFGGNMIGNSSDNIKGVDLHIDNDKHFRPNVGFGLLFPITKFLGIKGEFSYMNTEYADTIIGYNNEQACIISTQSTFTVPISVDFMYRPKKFMWDVFVGGSFLGNNKDIFAMAGTDIGRKVGKNGYLFADARFGWSFGEKFQSFGVGYEYVIPYSKEGGKKRHSIVGEPDTFTVVARVNNIMGGKINPSGDFRFKNGSIIGFAISTNEGWALDSLIVNDTVMTGDISMYSVAKLKEDMNILAMFSVPLPDTFTIFIKPIDEEVGEIRPSGAIRLQKGEEQKFTITSKIGYMLGNLIVDGKSVGAPKEYTVSNIDRDINVEAHFSEVKAVEIKQVATIQDGINFEVGTALLTDDSRRTLEGIYLTMAQNPDMKVEVSGHTDVSGGHAYNVQLSKNRAQAVVDYLVERGISAKRLTAIGHGPDKPVDDNKTNEGRAKNRRVEIRSY
jgi:outer membrane protein OmpA-like peptidoglycan-associated protein